MLKQTDTVQKSPYYNFFLPTSSRNIATENDTGLT